MIKLTQKDFTTLPWKNQGGTTLELFKITDPQDPGKFLIRFSIATVGKPGPFSIFEGIDRHLVLLSGKGMLLNFNVNQIILNQPYQKIEFKGEDAIECQLLKDETKDFNVMIDRNWGKVNVEIFHIKKNDIFTFEKAKTTYIYNCQLNEFSILSNEVFKELATDNFDYIVTTLTS